VRAHRIGAVAGVLGFVLALAGLSTLGDTPDPHDAAAPLARYFVEHRDAMFTSTALVALASVAVVIFLAVVRTYVGDAISATLVLVAGVGVVALLQLNELVYAALGYSVARDAPASAKTLFALTILSPVLQSPLVALLLGTVALRRGVLPRWLAYVSAAGAVLVVPGLVSFGDAGFLSPDVQQQVIAQVFFFWVLLAAIALWRVPARD
jgi:hypothetical protein